MFRQASFAFFLLLLAQGAMAQVDSIPQLDWKRDSLVAINKEADKYPTNLKGMKEYRFEVSEFDYVDIELDDHGDVLKYHAHTTWVEAKQFIEFSEFGTTSCYRDSNGIKYGPCVIISKEGRLSYIVNFHHDNPHGKAYSYTKKGILTSIQTWEYGNQTALIIFDKNGNSQPVLLPRS